MFTLLQKLPPKHDSFPKAWTKVTWYFQLVPFEDPVFTNFTDGVTLNLSTKSVHVHGEEEWIIVVCEVAISL
jgi:hypothetical protein